MTTQYSTQHRSGGWTVHPGRSKIRGQHLGGREGCMDILVLHRHPTRNTSISKSKLWFGGISCSPLSPYPSSGGTRTVRCIAHNCCRLWEGCICACARPCSHATWDAISCADTTVCACWGGRGAPMHGACTPGGLPGTHTLAAVLSGLITPPHHGRLVIS